MVGNWLYKYQTHSKLRLYLLQKKVFPISHQFFYLQTILTCATLVTLVTLYHLHFPATGKSNVSAGWIPSFHLQWHFVELVFWWGRKRQRLVVILACSFNHMFFVLFRLYSVYLLLYVIMLSYAMLNQYLPKKSISIFARNDWLPNSRYPWLSCALW